MRPTARKPAERAEQHELLSAASAEILPGGGRARRRGLLVGAVALATLPGGLAGCDSGPPPPPDPLTDFYLKTVALAARYEAAGTANPLLPLIRDTHKAHAAAIAAIMRPAPSPLPSAQPGSGAAPAVADLRKDEQTAQQEAAKLCLAANPDRATLLGEIAVARAAHLEALR